jgi:transposase-like protein
MTLLLAVRGKHCHEEYVWTPVFFTTSPHHGLVWSYPIAIRQVKYLNNIVEQDHRGVKRVTRPLLGFKSFEAAQSTLTGIELMHMLRKGELTNGSEQGLNAAEQFYALAA